MNCREFRAHHCAFVDDTLSAADMVAMRRHVERCPSCSQLDTRVRRSLLVVRNAPEIECSPDFALRLQARLRDLGPTDRYSTPAPSFLFMSVRYAALAAGVLAAGVVAAMVAEAFDESAPEVRMAPVVAVAPAIDPIPAALTSPDYVASVMSGMPVWPAVLVAGQSSAHVASYEFQLTGGQ